MRSSRSQGPRPAIRGRATRLHARYTQARSKRGSLTITRSTAAATIICSVRRPVRSSADRADRNCITFARHFCRDLLNVDLPGPYTGASVPSSGLRPTRVPRALGPEVGRSAAGVQQARTLLHPASSPCSPRHCAAGARHSTGRHPAQLGRSPTAGRGARARAYAQRRQCRVVERGASSGCASQAA